MVVPHCPLFAPVVESYAFLAPVCSLLQRHFINCPRNSVNCCGQNQIAMPDFVHFYDPEPGSVLSGLRGAAAASFPCPLTGPYARKTATRNAPLLICCFVPVREILVFLGWSPPFLASQIFLDETVAERFTWGDEMGND